jgi:GNAT superfamily N-acetyltransferase
LGIRRRFTIGEHAFVEFTTHRSWKENGTYRNPYIMVDFLYVAPEHRRKRYATRLLEKVKEVATESKLPIILSVIPYADKPMDVTQLRQMYYSMGFSRSYFDNMKWEPTVNEESASEMLKMVA